MNILVDNREKTARIASCVKFFTDAEYDNQIKSYTGNKNTMSIKTLPVGDYIFDDKLCIEYKTAIDCIGSIKDGRIFKQAEKIREYPYSYIMIVGDVSTEIDTYNKNIYRKYRQSDKKKIKPFTVNAYLGAVARLSLIGKVVHVNNMQQGWVLMNALANKMDSNKTHVDKPVKLDNPIASFLTCVKINKTKRLSEKNALKIQKELNLNTLQDLLNVSYDDLVDLNGIGSKTAMKICEVL